MVKFKMSGGRLSAKLLSDNCVTVPADVNIQETLTAAIDRCLYIAVGRLVYRLSSFKLDAVYRYPASIVDIKLGHGNVYVACNNNRIYRHSLDVAKECSGDNIFSSVLREGEGERTEEPITVEIPDGSCVIHREGLQGVCPVSGGLCLCTRVDGVWTFHVHKLNKHSQLIQKPAYVIHIGAGGQEMKRPVLISVTNRTPDHPSGSLCLSSPLFTCLYGEDPDVLTTALPDGRLLWFPLRLSDGPTPDVRMTYDMQQPIRAVYKTGLLSESLVIVGTLGKVLILSASHSRTMELYLPGPVMSHVICDVTRQGTSDIIYSDGRALLRAVISQTTTGLGLTTSRLPVQECSAVLHWRAGKHKGAQALLLSPAGRLSTIDPTSDVGSHPPVHDLERLLKDLQTCSEKLATVNGRIGQQRELLEDIGVAARLANSGRVSELFTVRCRFHSGVRTWDCEQALGVELFNGCESRLSPAWSVLVTVSGGGRTVQRCEPLTNGFSDGSRVQFQIPLPWRVSLTDLNLKVLCSLQYHVDLSMLTPGATPSVGRELLISRDLKPECVDALSVWEMSGQTRARSGVKEMLEDLARSRRSQSVDVIGRNTGNRRVSSELVVDKMWWEEIKLGLGADLPMNSASTGDLLGCDVRLEVKSRDAGHVAISVTSDTLSALAAVRVALIGRYKNAQIKTERKLVNVAADSMKKAWSLGSVLSSSQDLRPDQIFSVYNMRSQILSALSLS